MDAASGGRHTPHATSACINCRRRRVRCAYDDLSGNCVNCQRRGDLCIHKTEEDSRRSISYFAAKQLKDRIEDLEKENARLASLVSSGVGAGGSMRVATGLDDKSASRILDRLKVVGTQGEICHFGPTSAFSYLPDLGLIQTRAAHVETRMVDFEESKWKSCLPSQINLPWMKHERLLSLFTRNFASWLYVLDMDAFQQDMHTWSGVSKTDFYSPLLHNAVLAMACVYMEDDMERNAVDLFTERAVEYLSDEFELPAISTINGLMLLASLSTQRCQTNRGTVYFASAVQTAVNLGLNVDCSYLLRYGMINEDVQQLRINTFWSVYCQDRLWAVAVGRQPLVRTFTVPLPKVNEAVDRHPFVHGGQEVAGMVSSTFVEACKLSIIAGSIMDNIYGIATSSDLTRTCHAHHEQIVQWRNGRSVTLHPSSSSTIPPHVLTLDIVATVLALRPLYHNLHERPADNRAIELCNLHANRIIQDLWDRHERYGLHNGPFILAHAAFGAATIHLMSSVLPQTISPLTDHDPKSLIQQAISILRLMRHGRARQMSEILESLSTEWMLEVNTQANRELDELLQALFAANPSVLQSHKE